MLADDVIDPCDRSSTTILEVAVRPKCDIGAESPIVEAVRPKIDMDTEKSAELSKENDAVCPRCDEEATVVDWDAASKREKKAKDRTAAAKKILEENDEVTSEDVQSRRIIEESRNIARGEKHLLREVSKQIRMCIRKKTRKDTKNL